MSYHCSYKISFFSRDGPEVHIKRIKNKFSDFV